MQTTIVTKGDHSGVSNHLATVGDRLVATVIDLIIRVVYLFVSISALLNLDVESVWVWFVFALAPWIFYDPLFEGLMDGQTPGKRVMQIQVVKADGSQLSLGDITLRWALSILDFYLSLGLLSVIMVSLGKHSQRLGDHAADTLVIKRNFSTSHRHQAEYNPVFQNVRLLDPYVIELIQRAVRAQSEFENDEPVQLLYTKVKAVLGAESEMQPRAFLQTVLKDFNHLKAL